MSTSAARSTPTAAVNAVTMSAAETSAATMASRAARPRVIDPALPGVEYARVAVVN